MEEIGGGGLDLALLPIWGWGTSIGAGHLDPERAARAAALLSPRMVVPIHWGTLYPLGLARLRPGPCARPARARAPGCASWRLSRSCGCWRPGESTSLGVAVVPEAGEPAAEDPVDPLGADDVVLGQASSAGCSTKGSAWVPPMPPCEPTSSSKAATSPNSGQKVLLTIRSAQWGKPSVRRRWSAAFGPNGASGSSPSTRSRSRKCVPPAPIAIAP